MSRLTDFRFELRHNDYVVGNVCAGGTEFSDACNDDAIGWFGLRALTAHTARARALGVAFTGSPLPRPRGNFVPLIVR
jgi:hypothetical protein